MTQECQLSPPEGSRQGQAPGGSPALQPRELPWLWEHSREAGLCFWTKLLLLGSLSFPGEPRTACRVSCCGFWA